MPLDNGQTRSCWMQDIDLPSFTPLEQDAQADVCVIGGGIAGMTAAYMLAKEGLSVILLESGEIGSGETGRTTAHLAFALDDRFINLEKLFGAGGARLAAESHRQAVDRIESIVRAEDIDCDFHRLDGWLFNPSGEHKIDLDAEMEAARRAGLQDVEKHDRCPLPRFIGPALRFQKQGMFHPLKYLSGLARAIERQGGRIHTNTHVESIDEDKPVQVHTQRGIVTADQLVVATNSPVSDIVYIHTKMAPYRTYAIGMRAPRGAIEHALYWDTQDPYHYVRALSVGTDEDLWIIGGEDHRTGTKEAVQERFDRLEQWAREHLLLASPVVFRWSGQVMEPADSLAFIGRQKRSTPHIYIATGDSGHGMTHGTIAGMLITDLIAGRANAWAELYAPTRMLEGGLADAARHNIKAVGQLAKHLTPGEVETVGDIAPGEGAVVRSGMYKRAIYRDSEGELHELSATCTHVGCVVGWNGIEKSWDCPCHGSRFATDGRVLNAPACRPLDAVEEKERDVPRPPSGEETQLPPFLY